jgi:hypothetical protein
VGREKPRRPILKTRYSPDPKKALAVLKAWMDQHELGPEATRRVGCSLFGFWGVCTQKRCRRALMCSGDPYACFQRYWPHVPEEAKVRYRAMIRAAQAGLGAREIAAAARAAVAGWGAQAGKQQEKPLSRK